MRAFAMIMSLCVDVMEILWCFLSSVSPADFHPTVIRCNEWQHRLLLVVSLHIVNPLGDALLRNFIVFH